ncbi:MAG: aminotransferase class I/II-fold pyridoxal phosphate-dependent enzyme, partial [Dehalococcoidia bacterium]|nr:aminotransferase class I/II-fold pyridoxal phosphate-dependent enzyme [Dehalococcoidia bacterium]
QRRRDLLLQTLGEMGLKAKPPRASFYIWARIPEGYTSLEFATTLLEEAGVVVIPGISYGKCGEGYIRLSLTIPDHRLEEALSRLRAWHQRKVS